MSALRRKRRRRTMESIARLEHDLGLSPSVRAPAGSAVDMAQRWRDGASRRAKTYRDTP